MSPAVGGRQGHAIQADLPPLRREVRVKTRYEDSPADKRADKANAKKAGMSVRAWEKSPQDRKADAKGQRMMDAKGKKR